MAGTNWAEEARGTQKGDARFKNLCACIDPKVGALGGTGGLIAVDRGGNIALPFNTAGMYRGYVAADGSSFVAIYK